MAATTSSAKSATTIDGNVENFCYMVIEEFLMKKNMQCTLWEFRKEWKRPSEVNIGYGTFHLLI
jgi:hypothetical protein